MNLIFAGLSRKPTAALHLSQPSMWVSVDLKEFDHHDLSILLVDPIDLAANMFGADVAPVMLRGQEWVEHRDNPRFKVARRIRSYSCFQFHWSKETQLLSTKNLGELEEGFQPPWQGSTPMMSWVMCSALWPTTCTFQFLSIMAPGEGVKTTVFSRPMCWSGIAIVETQNTLLDSLLVCLAHVKWLACGPIHLDRARNMRRKILTPPSICAVFTSTLMGDIMIPVEGDSTSSSTKRYPHMI